MTKKEVRFQMIHQREMLTTDQILQMSFQITQQIKNDPDFIKATCISIFYPMKGEVNLLGLLNEHQTFCFPKITENAMVFIAYEPHQAFELSKFGVKEPIDGIICNDKIDYMLVPALAISKDLHRIGYGKGYYDAYLLNDRPKKVMGVIFDFQELLEMPYFKHDQKLDGYFKGKL